jgi:hypothetical protein
MKKTIFGTCALLMVVSLGLFAQTNPSTKKSRSIQCQIVPTTPFSRSCQAKYTGVKKSNPKMGSRISRSLNWGGYASLTNLTHPTIGSVSGVRGVWKVPSIRPSANTSYSACWVGIDGYSNETVEQIGTAQAWVNGHSVYYAWFSMYPGPSYEILGFPVNPKDRIKAEVSYVGNNVFEMVIKNLSRGVYFVVPSSYTTLAGVQRTSAEWIVEAPSLVTILPLTHFSPVPFSHCVTTIKGSSGKIDSRRWKNSRIIMVTENGAVKAKPSTLSHSGKKFTVKWHHQ